MATRKITDDKRRKIDENLKVVFEALDEKGYQPVAQIWGYLLTEDPTYVTTYKNARKLISEIEHEDLGTYLLEHYFKL